MLMVQSKPQAAVKSSKLKPPPPVPPRPNQNVVAEALAKTRKAVAESKLTKRNSKDEQKAKTLERTTAAGASPQNTSPKLNGLARVKSFIRDVISDRSSADDKKSGNNSRRSSVDAVSPPPAKSAADSRTDSKSAGKTIKNCRQALVRSLSTSTKSEQESKGRVLKSSSSFAEKNLPLRKAPPPPLSPKPKLREVKPLSVPKRNSMEINQKLRITPPAVQRPSVSPPKTPPIEESKSEDTAVDPSSSVSEAPYATVDEVSDFDNRLSSSPEPAVSRTKTPENSAESGIPLPKYTSSLERKTSRVTERLISEIIASKNKPKDANNVIDKGKEFNDDLILNGTSEHGEGVPNLKEMNNHEILIYELQTMRSQTQIPKTEGEETGLNCDDCNKSSSGRSSPSPSIDLSETSEHSVAADPNVCDDDPLKNRLRKQFKAISSMSLQGLPPLPKSLSCFAEGPLRDGEAESPSPEEVAPGDMEAQLALLKREMASLRRLDLSLLSELWSLNEAMASWRQQLERAPRLRPAPPPPPHQQHYLRT